MNGARVVLYEKMRRLSPAFCSTTTPASRLAAVMTAPWLTVAISRDRERTPASSEAWSGITRKMIVSILGRPRRK